MLSLVEARSTALLRLAFAVVGDHQLAQDLLQEALVKVYVAWPRLRDASAAEAYVRRTIVTTAISWRRRPSFHEPPVEVVPDRGHGDETDRLATHRVLWQQVRGLPPRQRTALVLRYYEDLSEAETAELMGCSVGHREEPGLRGVGQAARAGRCRSPACCSPRTRR